MVRSRSAGNSGSKTIRIPRDNYKQMKIDVESRSPYEACGLVAGTRTRQFIHSRKIFPAKNVSNRMDRYIIDPVEQLKIFNLIDEHDWELVAIYHSHPQGTVFPSEQDRRNWFYPQAVCLIWGRLNLQWILRAYTFEQGFFHNLEINVV